MGEQKPEFRAYCTLVASLADDADKAWEGGFPKEWKKNPLSFYDEWGAEGIFESFDEAHAGYDISSRAYIEALWLETGSPYFKLYPNLVDQLCHVSLNVDVKYVQPPFEWYAILLSVKHPLGGCVCEPMLVSHSTREMLEARGGNESLLRKFNRKGWCGVIRARYTFYDVNHPPTEEYRRTGNISINLLEDGTAEDSLNEWLKYAKGAEKDYPETYVNCDKEKERKRNELVARVILATSLVGVSKHELVLPDLTKRQRQRLERAAARGDTQRVAEIEAKATGWVVGRDVELPQWSKQAAVEEGEQQEGHALTHAHIRRGHMRMQPHGPNNSLRKIIYVAPVWVRPDLPVGPARGYVVKE